MTPIPSAISRPLIEGLRNEVVVRDATAAEVFPTVRPIGYEEAVARALRELDDGAVATTWTDAAGRGPSHDDRRLESREGMLLERRRVHVAAAPERVFAVVVAIGGAAGWPYLDGAWRLRGLLDRVVGGVGMRRGRRDPLDLRVGDALDFWRVEAVERDRLLRLRAEMRVPGKAWLQFEVTPEGESSTLVQTAFFAPRGLTGLAYWYLLYPVHGLIFSGMISELARRSAAGG